jgi:hypothetical protein
VLTRDSTEPREVIRPFRFGSRPTATFVAFHFPNGVMAEAVECVPAPDGFPVPAQLLPLIDEACRIVNESSPSGSRAVDAPLFAPVRVERIENYDEQPFEQIKIWLAESHYRFYTAFAFAEILTARNEKFKPLLAYVQQMADPAIPSPASCSLGTRIILETADQRLVVCYRSRSVKMNPSMWSSSANEGVRPNLLKDDIPFGRLLEHAARKALYNELRLQPDEVSQLVLLSLHQNAYAQWGASFYAATPLAFEEVKRRQPMADHRGEHRRVAALPTDLQACGAEMANLGIRWYGGALETICTVLSWRELANGVHTMPEDIGAVLDNAGGRIVLPCDEINQDFVRSLVV